MQETLYIENFGPIKKATLDLRQAMVFIGPQSSGKSTISKLISVMRNWDFVLQKKTFDDLILDFNLTFFVKANTIISYTCDGYEFRYEKSKGEFYLNQNHQLFEHHKEFLSKIKQSNGLIENVNLNDILNSGEIEIETNDELVKKLNQQIEEKEALLAKENTPEKISKLKEELYNLYTEVNTKYDDYKIILETKIKVIKSINSYASYSTYIPAERILISFYSDSIFAFLNSNLSVPKTILNFGSLFQRAKKSTSSLALITKSFRYSNENGEDFVYFNDDEKMKLSESSSGIQTLLPLLIVINHFSNSLLNRLNSYIIEEPEQNLYPQTQKDLIYYLTSRCIKFSKDYNKNSGLIITTHSPYTLSSFNNLLFAYQVAQKKSGEKTEVIKIIAEESWVNPDEFNAYFVADGTVREIFNRETGLIDENELDSASEEINGDFEQLMDIYKGIKA